MATSIILIFFFGFGFLPWGIGVIDAFFLARELNKGVHVDEFDHIGTLWL